MCAKDRIHDNCITVYETNEEADGAEGEEEETNQSGRRRRSLVGTFISVLSNQCKTRHLQH